MERAILICATLVIGAGCVCTATGTQAEETADTSGPAPNEVGCQVAWSIASPKGATLSKDQAAPYVVNFDMADTNQDGAIAADEFKAACLGGYTTFWAKSAPHTCPHGVCTSDGIAYCCP
jgi:hypothetical protein